MTANIKSSARRLQLEVRAKAYDFTEIEPGISLGYRRRAKGAGSWVVRIADGKGGNSQQNLDGIADDFEPANDKEVLSFWQAMPKALAMAQRGRDSATVKTVADAIAFYADDLAARGAGPENASRIRKNVPTWFADKLVGQLTAADFDKWRDELKRRHVNPTTIVRLGRAVKAALNHAVKHDPKIRNADAWKDGFKGVGETYKSRNDQVIPDDQVRELIAACYGLDEALGLYVEVAAETGARPSQISRLVIDDLEQGGLMMPPSKKGHKKRPEYSYVPITAQLGDKLKLAAAGRKAREPLLLRADGRRWQETDKGDYANLFEKVVAQLDLPITFYALRHSAIVRMIKAGVNVTLVAKRSDSSVEMFQRTYTRYIDRHDRTTVGLLAPAAPQPESNVIALRA